VTARLNFLHDRVGLVEHVDVPCGLCEVVDIFSSGPGGRGCARHRRDPRLGHDQRLAEAAVEALGGVAHQLDVLALVLPHRHLVRAVGEHVAAIRTG
jgi:hypothetical protein